MHTQKVVNRRIPTCEAWKAWKLPDLAMHKGCNLLVMILACVFEVRRPFRSLVHSLLLTISLGGCVGLAQAAAPIKLATTSLPAATVGAAYQQQLNVTGGAAPYSWSVLSGGLPDGLALNPVNGQITGTATASGPWVYSYPFQAYIGVTDSKLATAAASFTINVLPPPSTNRLLTVINGTGGGSYAPNAIVSISANAASAGKAFKNWSGATVANASSPNTTLVMPNTNTTVTANYITSATNAPSAPLALTTAIIPNATVGTTYSQTLGATGGKPPYVWAVAGGGLPDGLTLGSATGQITGTPTASGSWVYSYPFQAYISVTDSANTVAARAYSLTVLPSTNAQFTLTVVNGSGGGTFAANTSVSITAASAPAGQVFKGWTGATVANALAPSTTLVMPAASTTVTATYSGPVQPPPTLYKLTVANGSGSGSYAANTTVAISANNPPAGQIFVNWTGAGVANSAANDTTVTMPASNLTVTANYAPSIPLGTTIPQPVTGHPRLWLTAADLPKFRSWAVATNPVYQQGLVPLLNQAIADYNTKFFPGGQPNPVNPDLGDTQGYQGLITEQYALIFALHSLIDPNPAARIQHAQRARNLIMVPMNIAAQGALPGAPFRDPLFSVYNRANATSEAWPLVVDWIYSALDANQQPILTAQDKATIRTVFLRWANECLNAYTTGGDHPAPVGVENSLSLLPGGNAYRMAANNYYLGHARLLTLMALAFDPVDDPAINPASSVAVLGNSLRSYIANATGAWLYQQFAMLGDPSTVRAAFGLSPTASVGLSSGGLPPEGMLYGHSYSFLLGQLLALKTAGFADPALSGPQANLANNPPVFDRFVKGMISSLVPAAKVFPSDAYLGPVYQMASYGDILRLWMTPDFVQPFALLALLDQKNGDTSRLNAERWFAVNAVEGGAANLLNRIQNPWSYGVQDALLAFLLLDPAAPAATDPRPAYPTAFYDAPQGRLVEHTDWSANATMFDFRCSWISINHQQADANQFEFYRKGEWLTKGVANYDNNIVGLTTDYHNTLSLKNWCSAGTPANLGWWEGPFWANGSQWQLGGSAGDPTATVSVQPGYTYAGGDTTPLYNKPSPWSPANAALDILHASRSLVWLKPDHIVIYDRATSKTAGLFKRFNLALTAAPSVNANVVTTTTSGGQHLYITSLLPAGATLTSAVVGPELNPIAGLEPSNHRITIENPSAPTDVRFLTVLQGADAATPADPALLLQSLAGNVFEGTSLGTQAVLFKRDVTTPFTGVTYVVPATVTSHYVTGLAPNAGYTVVTQSVGGALQVTISPGGQTATADAAGVLYLSY